MNLKESKTSNNLRTPGLENTVGVEEHVNETTKETFTDICVIIGLKENVIKNIQKQEYQC